MMASCKDCVHYEVCMNFAKMLFSAFNASEDDAQDLLKICKGDATVCNDFADRARVAALPCKVGDTVYRLIHGTIDEYKVVSINYYVCSTFTDYTITSKHLSAPVNFNFDVNAIGKIVFLSREEAEQALGA